MSRYVITLGLDTDDYRQGTPLTELVRASCPHCFGFTDLERCNNCRVCWEEALKGGINNNAKFVHFKRLD